MPNYGRYPAELRERAVRMVLDGEWRHGSRWEAVCSVAEKLGASAESVRNQVRRAEIDGGAGPGVTTPERKRVEDLERERCGLRRANEILKAASALVGLRVGAGTGVM